MRAYIAISYNKRNSLQTELNVIKSILELFSIDAFVFVDKFSFRSNEEKQMMQQAFTEIDQADLLIAEVSDKAIGIGVEVGYAKAKNKPIIYLRNTAAEHSTTIAGTSDHVIIYNDASNLEKQLAEILKKITLIRK